MCTDIVVNKSVAFVEAIFVKHTTEILVSGLIIKLKSFAVTKENSRIMLDKNNWRVLNFFLVDLNKVNHCL